MMDRHGLYRSRTTIKYSLDSKKIWKKGKIVRGPVMINKILEISKELANEHKKDPVLIILAIVYPVTNYTLSMTVAFIPAYRLS